MLPSVGMQKIFNFLIAEAVVPSAPFLSYMSFLIPCLKHLKCGVELYTRVPFKPINSGPWVKDSWKSFITFFKYRKCKHRKLECGTSRH